MYRRRKQLKAEIARLHEQLYHAEAARNRAEALAESRGVDEGPVALRAARRERDWALRQAADAAAGEGRAIRQRDEARRERDEARDHALRRAR